MKKRGYLINTMFKDVSTLTVLFDRRRSHSADVISKESKTRIDRLHDLEVIYREEIDRQVQRISGRDTRTLDMTIRFSFISSECFDAMQFSDCLIYLLRKKIEQEEIGAENAFTRLFDKYFLSDLDPHTRSLGFKKIYEFDKKFNFFQSRA